MSYEDDFRGLEDEFIDDEKEDNILDLLRTIDPETLNEGDLTNDDILEAISLILSDEITQRDIELVDNLRRIFMETELMLGVSFETLIFGDRLLYNLEILDRYFKLTESGSRVSYLEVATSIIFYYQDDPTAGIYLDNAIEVLLDDVDEEILRDTIELISSKEFTEDYSPYNRHRSGAGYATMMDILNGRLEDVTPPLDPPLYVDDFEIDIDNLPRLTPQTLFHSPSDEMIAEALLKNGNIHGIELRVDDPIAQVTALVEKMTVEEKKEFTLAFSLTVDQIDSIRENKDLFRVYGPVNPYFDTDYTKLMDEDDDEDVNVVFGGARMFLDMELEWDEYSDIPANDWFTGNCDRCKAKIEKRKYAVRRPFSRGGWLGCYCSWEHVMSDLIDNVNLNAMDDPEVDLNDYKITKGLIEMFEEQMKEIGIDLNDFPI